MRLKNALPFLLPVLLFIFQSLLFVNWYLDDAGISFAYSRNLASGHGLVHQADSSERVEGYSNFSWVLLCSAFHYLGLFSINLTPRILSILLVCLSFMLLNAVFSNFLKTPPLIRFLTFFLISINSSFVIWNNAGMENPLYTFFIVTLFALSMKYVSSGVDRSGPVLFSLLLLLVSISRPEGIIYVAVFPAVFMIERFYRNHPPPAKDLFIFLFSSAALYAGFLFFRFSYFRDVVPNTYYAKGGGIGLETLIDCVFLNVFTKPEFWEIMTGFAGKASFIVLLFIVASSLFLGMNKKLSKTDLVILLFYLMTLLNFLVLPADWNPEFRFGTPHIVFFYVLTLHLAAKCLDLLKGRLNSRLVFLLVTVAVVFNLQMFYHRTSGFIDNPPNNLFYGYYLYGERFLQYSRVISDKKTDLLTPDLGSVVYLDCFRVHDLAGLCSRKIARLYFDADSRGLQEYIFDTLKPSFILLHRDWDRVLTNNGCNRLTLDYTMISDHVLINRKKCRQLEFVRSDLVDEAKLASLARIDRMTKSIPEFVTGRFSRLK